MFRGSIMRRWILEKKICWKVKVHLWICQNMTHYVTSLCELVVFLVYVQRLCTTESVCQLHLTNNITPTVQTPTLEHIKKWLISCLHKIPNNIQQCRSHSPKTETLTPTCSCSSYCLVWLWAPSLLQMTIQWSYSVATVPCSGTASTAAATSTPPHVWPGLMQSSTVCQREPTWCLSTVWRKRISSKPWSRTLTMLMDSPGLDSVTSTKKAGGCGLMVVLWTFTFGGQLSQTTHWETNTAFTTTMVQNWNGMTISVL